jgi:hypothetical protein
MGYCVTVGLLSIFAPPQWIPGQRPFAASSPINTLLASGTPLATVPWDASNGSNYFAGVKFFFDIPAPGAPICSFTPSAGWGWPSVTINRPMTSGLTGANDGVDFEAISILGTHCLSLNSFTRTSDTTATCFVYAECDILNDSGFGDINTFIGAGVLGAGCSCLVGALAVELCHSVTFPLP